jgi:hypothetical protein
MLEGESMLLMGYRRCQCAEVPGAARFLGIELGTQSSDHAWKQAAASDENLNTLGNGLLINNYCIGNCLVPTTMQAQENARVVANPL